MLLRKRTIEPQGNENSRRVLVECYIEHLKDGLLKCLEIKIFTIPSSKISGFSENDKN